MTQTNVKMPDRPLTPKKIRKVKNKNLASISSNPLTTSSEMLIEDNSSRGYNEELLNVDLEPSDMTRSYTNDRKWVPRRLETKQNMLTADSL